jgi:quercetin dioxygenase-like cupin family protein
MGRGSAVVGLEVRAHAGLISRGEIRALDSVPFHSLGLAPLTRRVLAGDGLHDELGKRVVAHELREVSDAQRSYCEPHRHDCAEINILLSLSKLVYEIRLGNEVYIVEAPASIYIPAGLVHSANVIEGSGFFIAMIETANYSASAAPAPRT